MKTRKYSGEAELYIAGSFACATSYINDAFGGNRTANVKFEEVEFTSQAFGKPQPSLDSIVKVVAMCEISTNTELLLDYRGTFAFVK